MEPKIAPWIKALKVLEILPDWNLVKDFLLYSEDYETKVLICRAIGVTSCPWSRKKLGDFVKTHWKQTFVVNALDYYEKNKFLCEEFSKLHIRDTSLDSSESHPSEPEYTILFSLI